MRRAELSMNGDDITENLTDEMKSEILSAARQKEEKSFETLYLPPAV